MKLRNILKQEKFNGLNKILFFGLAILFVVAAITNKNWFLFFVAFCFAVVGFSPQGNSGNQTKTERMQEVADELEAIKNEDIDSSEETEDVVDDDDTINSTEDDSEDSE